MKRPCPLALRAVLFAAAAAGSVTAGADPAFATPTVTYGGGAIITAQVTGERPGYACQIAARDIDGPWRTVNAAGGVELESGPVPAGRHVVRVLCENRTDGDFTTHIVGRDTAVATR
ncbi:hypothetical protein [Nocardia mexicana]|uniref:Ig-like domain-containing protein n=1 Tax=Nocardia mexicana TaxID=279262 RepID=A0A370GGG0_9NOCA|nr:hypothetical protein [Nocardia mexicana]RDI42751.1 hypothetical protein DFR68_12414 [Nocardia mexicana]